MHRSVFFHIGLHKTATGWFQRQFFPHLDGVEVRRELDFKRIGELVSQDRSSLLVISHERMSGWLEIDKAPGDCDRILEHSLSEIPRIAPDSAILIGFREQGAWINSAFAQKARQLAVSPSGYLKTFSVDELSWCKRLETIDARFDCVFPFLYEELVHDPERLVADMCQFLNVPPPQALHDLLAARENPSPRSRAGQLVSRPFSRLSKALERRRLGDQKTMRFFGARLGAQLDRVFPAREVAFDDHTKRVLEEDWRSLLRLIGDRRGRDFDALKLRAVDESGQRSA